MRGLKQSLTESIASQGKQAKEFEPNWNVDVNWDKLLPDVAHLEVSFTCSQQAADQSS